MNEIMKVKKSSPKPILTPKELEYKHRLQNLTLVKNRALSAYSFKKLRTHADLYSIVGVSSDNDDKPITLQEIREFFDKQKQQIDKKYKDNDTKTISEAVSESNNKSTDVILGNERTSRDSTAIATRTFSYNAKPAKQKANLLYFQDPAAEKICKKLFEEDKRAILLIGNAGIGKTFIVGSVLRNILDSKYIDEKTFSPWPIIYISRSSIIEQTRRVMIEYFGIDYVNEVHVLNIEQLRAKFGELIVRFETTIVNGEPVITPKWRKNLEPLIVIVDECQSVKNEDSIQSQILQSYNDLENPNIRMLFLSATPFTRVSEAKVFTVATGVKVQVGISKEKQPLTNKNWPDFSRNIASDYGRTDTKPDEHSPVAIERLITELLDYIVDVKNVQSKFHARNSIELIDFSSKLEWDEYNNAYENWLREKAKLESESESGNPSPMAFMVALLKFRMAAEKIRAPLLARRAKQKIDNGQVAVIAACFKPTIANVVKCLVYDYNIPRNRISLIWGGGKSSLSSKKKKAIEVSGNKNIMSALAEAGLDLGDFDLDDNITEEDKEKHFDPNLRLGMQSLKERQSEIDKFQNGKSDVCIFTFKSGGVGLSLHHEYPHTKQRNVDITPTYSAIELVQGLGRCPRITSLSDTPQTLLFYRGTVEQKVALKVATKLRCLKKVIRAKEHWEDCIYEWNSEDSKSKAVFETEKQIASELMIAPTDNEEFVNSEESEEE